jgi:AcrR family transcriptional regulator
LSRAGNQSAIGLRERKKAKTRAAIQTHALRLFRRDGYDATTVQQIIEAADVSESTFFRYFPTKADVVLTDDFDPLIVESFLTQPAHLRPIPALRAAFHAVFAGLSDAQQLEQRERMLLVMAVPELRAAMLDQFAAAMQLMAEIFAQRVGRDAADMRVRTVAGAVVGAAIAAIFTLVDDPAADLAAKLDEAMAFLDSGLEL